MQIVNKAAQAALTKNNATLSVHGYTDTTGSTVYNTKLSLRRADNVAARLIADGVPRREVTVKAYGETQPLVHMPQTMPNRYNRRVEIFVR
jgi:OOP family OmpA-OmpF porin